MVKYVLSLNPRRLLYEWLIQQPNFVSVLAQNNEKIICEFNHTTEEQTLFKQEIANRLFQISAGSNTFESIFESTLPHLEVLQRDIPIHISELVTNISFTDTNFKDLYSGFGGRNFFIDLNGFNKIRYMIRWSTNGGTGTHNLRIVDNAIQTNVLFDVIVTNGQNVANVTIPDPLFKNFRGRVRIQVKSTVQTDTPILDSILLYGLTPNRE